jgi:hypothetical protein
MQLDLWRGAETYGQLGPLARWIYLTSAYVLTSHPIAIIVLRQSSGKYAIHRRMLSSERLMSSSARQWIGETASDNSDVASTKYRFRT